MAFLFETKEFLHGFLRPGETYTGNVIARFLLECLARLPKTIRTITFRADSGFFVEAAMLLLEQLGHYAAKLYPIPLCGTDSANSGRGLSNLRGRLGNHHLPFRLG